MSVKLLIRERLTSKLMAALNYPLAVLIAPIGYGKTIAIDFFLKKLEYRYFHLTINPGSNSAAYIWDSLCAQLEVCGAASGTILRSLGFPKDNLECDRALEIIGSHLKNIKCLVVIDDYHFANAPEFGFFLERLVKKCIPEFTIFIVSRSRPEINVEELRIKRLANIFESGLLRFTMDEAIQYFSIHGIENKDAAVKAWQISEGWAAALWLIVEDYKNYKNLAAPRDVEKLLERSVFARHTKAEQSLLIQLADLDEFSPEQAAFIVQDESTPCKLNKMRDENAFINFNPASGRYRLHGIFRSFLAKFSDQGHGFNKTVVRRRAADWFATHNNLLMAFRLWALIGEEEDLLNLLGAFESAQGGALFYLAPNEIIKAIAAIPWTLRLKKTLGYLGFVYFYISLADPVKGVALLKEAEEIICSADTTITDELKKRLAGEIALIYGLLSFNNIAAMKTAYIKAHNLLGGRSAISTSKLIWTFGSPHVSYLFLREAGSYRQTLETIESGIGYYQEMSGGCSLGAKELMHAEMLLETGFYDEVELQLDRAVAMADISGQLSTIVAAEFARARLLILRGKEEDAVSSLNSLTSRVAEAGSSALSNSLDLALGYINALLGRYDDIPVWLREGDIVPSRGLNQILGFVQTVHARALLLTGEATRLDAAARIITAYVGPYQNIFAIIHSKILEAIAAYEILGHDAALEPMATAMTMARADGLLLIFIEYGKYVLPLLKILRKQYPKDVFLSAAINGAKNYRRSPNRRIEESMLSPREKEMLNLAAKGRNNQSIAKILGVTTITVGKTLSSAYAKLKAKNRADAVRKLFSNS